MLIITQSSIICYFLQPYHPSNLYPRPHWTNVFTDRSSEGTTGKGEAGMLSQIQTTTRKEKSYQSEKHQQTLEHNYKPY